MKYTFKHVTKRANGLVFSSTWALQGLDVVSVLKPFVDQIQNKIQNKIQNGKTTDRTLEDEYVKWRGHVLLDAEPSLSGIYKKIRTTQFTQKNEMHKCVFVYTLPPAGDACVGAFFHAEMLNFFDALSRDHYYARLVGITFTPAHGAEKVNMVALAWFDETTREPAALLLSMAEEDPTSKDLLSALRPNAIFTDPVPCDAKEVIPAESAGVATKSGLSAFDF